MPGVQKLSHSTKSSTTSVLLFYPYGQQSGLVQGGNNEPTEYGWGE